MIVSEQIAIYPLRQERLTPAISAVRAALEAAGLQPGVGAMSTVVTGEAATVFKDPSGAWRLFEREAAG